AAAGLRRREAPARPLRRLEGSPLARCRIIPRAEVCLAFASSSLRGSSMSQAGPLRGLLEVMLRDPAIRQIVEAADRPQLTLEGPAAARPLTAAALAAANGADRPVLLVTATEREAEESAAALTGLLEPEAVAVFPSWETLPHERLSPRADTVGRRLAVLRRLAPPEGSPHGPTRAPVTPGPRR